jgi:catechol 2,3-dioxygenase-like lactoylglutathione lyase family enzyme
MKPLGINRVVIAVRDLDRAVRFYSELLGATFHDASAGAEPFGIKAALSWDAGIELVAPLPGRDSVIARSIEESGQGLRQVIFAVDDVDEARLKLEHMGIGVVQTIEFTHDQLREYFKDRFGKFKEYVLNPADTCGAQLVVGQFDRK